MIITLLDAESYGEDVDLSGFEDLGDVQYYPQTTPGEAGKRIEKADIVVINNVPLSNEQLDNAEHLKLIAIAATGMDNVDLDYCREKGIAIRNVPAYATDSVAQHTFAMLFQLLEQTSYYDHYIKTGEWSRSGNPTNLSRVFFQLSGSRWGIIGMGNIGRRVAELAAAFGCDVVYYKREGGKSVSGYEGLSLEELFKSSRIVSIHAPLTDSTYNLITAQQLLLLQQGAIILNLGRGGILDENALVDAIDNHGIFAGLDVFSSEPLLPDSPLLRVKHKDHLLMTPHIGFAAKEARQAVVDRTIENIRNALNSGLSRSV